MADAVLVDSKLSTGINTIEVFYTSPSSGDGTTITAFSAINNSGVNASYKAYIYNSSGVAVGPVIPTKIVVRNRFDIGPSITNQLIPNGGTLRMESSAISSITFRVSGVEL
mgnify:CR=1 FL=1